MTVEGHIENGQIILNQPVVLPEGKKVRVEVLEGEPSTSALPTELPATTQFDHYAPIVGAIDDLPNDFAAQHDHYVHGTPKK